uniref:Putative lipocalin-2 1 n=1 Tax=Amblyomma triste TaxID=251400 RepID=A0A023GAC9_AMBTT
MKCLVVAVVLALGATANKQKFSKEDLRKALETDEKLWTLKRNFTRDGESRPVTCIYDKKISLEQDEYKFSHHFIVAEDWKQVLLYGTIQEEDEDVVLLIKEKEAGDKGNKHVLQALNEEKKCFILTYDNATSGVVQCSLHVPESVATEESAGGLPCVQLYEKTCKGDTPKTIYTNECRKNPSSP